MAMRLTLRIARVLAAASAVIGAAMTSAQAEPAILFEVQTGRVLFADDPDQHWHPASLTKMMTAYLTFEALTKGKIKLDGEVELSPKARAQPATRVGLRRGIKLNFDQAVRALIIRSANDFAMALAENIDGSEEAFVKRMNETAQRLGMTRTHFANPHGLPDIEQVTTARDMATLTVALARDYPQFADVFTATSVSIHKGTFHSHNDLLRTLEGGDGMKTGFTCGAGYNVVATATREGRRLAAVILGAQNGSKRSQRASELIEHGFAIYEWKALGPPETLNSMTLKTIAMSPPEAGEPTYTAGTKRIRRCASRRPVIEPPTPDADDDIVQVAAPDKDVSGKSARSGKIAQGDDTKRARPRRTSSRSSAARRGRSAKRSRSSSTAD